MHGKPTRLIRPENAARSWSNMRISALLLVPKGWLGIIRRMTRSHLPFLQLLAA